ncbi:hypothetical protein FG386_002286 [Cryptosporidium ryanae]|uniref:uncharacterized protein n=1 Tax=Cryptosporidium ryanae TaxID=515981 RepID=UPI00351A5E6F|nr:hypothetical protein FG386_002286 [Cryptosporidium ryanae]
MVEIFASERSRVGERVNFKDYAVNKTSKIDEIYNVNTLKEIYDELIDFTCKLIESNKTMEEYKYDKDILEAIEENASIIRRKRETIEKIEKRFYMLEREDLINRENKLINDISEIKSL